MWPIVSFILCCQTKPNKGELKTVKKRIVERKSRWTNKMAADRRRKKNRIEAKKKEMVKQSAWNSAHTKRKQKRRDCLKEWACELLKGERKGKRQQSNMLSEWQTVGEMWEIVKCRWRCCTNDDVNSTSVSQMRISSH